MCSLPACPCAALDAPHPLTAGERLSTELAPELTSLLSQLDSPAGVANYVPATNAVLSEMARRGVTRDALLRTLARMGADMPQPAVEMLQASRSAARRLA